ncbi:MAG: LolA family protein [Actinomycetota bacterium]
MLRTWATAGATLAVVLALGAGAAAQGKKTASFTVTAVQSGAGVQVSATSKVWITPTRARADVKHPLKGEVRFVVTDGYFYQLDPKAKTGVKRPLPPALAKNPDNFQFLLSQLVFDASDVLKVAKKVRTETLSGYKCDVYTKSAAKDGAKRSITVWMPQTLSPKFPIKAVKTDNVTKPGATVSQTDTITLSKVVVNANIPASLFSVAGYKVVEGKPQTPKPGK